MERIKEKRFGNQKEFRGRIDAHKDVISTKTLPHAKGVIDPRIRGLVVDGTRVLAECVDANKLSVEHALLFCPPDTKVSKSRTVNRWRAQWKAFSISRCSTLHGEFGAFRQCAAFVWAQYTRVQGHPCPYDFLADVKWD